MGTQSTWGFFTGSVCNMKLTLACLFLVVVVGVISTRVEDIEEELNELHYVYDALEEDVQEAIEDEMERRDEMERSEPKPPRRGRRFRFRGIIRKVRPLVPVAVRAGKQIYG